MADKPISGLTAAESVGDSDLFVLEQDGQAKKLTGQTLMHGLAVELDGHGGIASIAKTGTSGLVDTYTITFADGTNSTFSVTNGDSIDHISTETVTPSDPSRAQDIKVNVYLTSAPSMIAYYFIVPGGNTGAQGEQGIQGIQGEAGARAWLSSSAPINADGTYIFTPSQISTPAGITATPQVGDMIWWTNNYYFITQVFYSGGQVNSYGCNNTYAILPGNYVNNVYYAEYGVTATGALEDAWAAGKAIFCVMPQAQQDDPQNILTLSCVYDTGHGYNGFIFSAVHHDSDTYLEVARCGQSAINSWNTATYTFSGGGGSDGVFVATVGTTTKAQIDAAITAGKFVVAYWATGGINNEPCYYSLSEVLQSNSGYVFSMFDGTFIHYVTVDSTDSWDGDTVLVPAPQSAGTPAALGTAARGSATTYSRSDHVHKMPSASDVGAVALAQGVQYAGDFLVVGNNGNVVPVTMSAWSAGSY